MLDFSANKKNIKDYLIQSLRKIWPGIRRYFRKFLDNTIQILVVSIGVFLLESLILYISRGFWALYTSTPVGERFISQFPGGADFLMSITREPVLYFAFGATKVALIVCSGLAACCQFIYIARFLYYSRGVIGKTVWAAGVTALTANMFQQEWAPLDFSVAFVAVIIPVVFILPSCFKMANMVLPEIADLFRSSYLKNACQLIKISFQKFQR